MKIENFNRIADLRKKNAQFRNMMNDMETLAKANRKKSIASSIEVRLHALEEKDTTQTELMNGILDMNDVLLGFMEQMLNRIDNQDIKIVKSSRKRLQSSAPTVKPDDVVRKAVSEENLPEYLKGIRTIDRELYLKNGRIYYKTIGLSPMIIQYNEFDLALLESIDEEGNVTFDISDLQGIAKRWSSFNNMIKEYIGPNMTLKTFVLDYTKHRGIPFVHKKRGRASKSSEVTTYTVEV